MTKKQVKESGLSRISDYIRTYSCGIITAFRSEYGYKENKKRNAGLLNILVGRGYEATFVQGSYVEKSKHTLKFKEVKNLDGSTPCSVHTFKASRPQKLKIGTVELFIGRDLIAKDLTELNVDRKEREDILSGEFISQHKNYTIVDSTINYNTAEIEVCIAPPVDKDTDISLNYQRQTNEHSFFVVNRKGKDDGGELEKDLFKLGVFYEQESVLSIREGKAYLIGTKESDSPDKDVWPQFKERVLLGSGKYGKAEYAALEFFSKIKGRPFIFTERFEDSANNWFSRYARYIRAKKVLDEEMSNVVVDLLDANI